MIPTILEIPLPFGLGALPLHSFGLCMVLAFLAAWRILYLTLEEHGEDSQIAEQLVTWAAIGGIVGARVCYLLTFPDQLFSHPLSTIFGGAGFVFYGGFIGGAIAVWWTLRRQAKPFWFYGDLAAASLALGYAIGRLGCQLSGDGDYGVESSLPWAMSYSLGVVPTPLGVRVHPAPVYETLYALLLTWILLQPGTRRLLPHYGQLFGLYLLFSSVARYLVEMIRIEPQILSGLTQAQLISMALGALGVAAMLLPWMRSLLADRN